jgi:hypothetical protein
VEPSPVGYRKEPHTAQDGTKQNSNEGHRYSPNRQIVPKDKRKKSCWELRRGDHSRNTDNQEKQEWAPLARVHDILPDDLPME